jgi:pyruvate dehydrogenase E1 component
MTDTIHRNSMFLDEFKHQLPDLDEGETDDWIQSLDDVVEQEGETRARFLLFKLLKRARQLQVGLPPLTNTRYINTISPEQEPVFPGDEVLERRIRRLIRWNAVAMVLRANSKFSGIGGHLATYASAATLYEVGFNWFFRGRDGGSGEGTLPGDQIFYQGHAAPGIYARAFLEGRISEEQLDHFRRETPPQKGLSSYPHPRLMPDFWEFPTVSMGLGPISAIYQARYNRYLQNRGLLDTSGSRVWAFLGDGETDEPESLGALHVAAQEGLDNLTFVVNCNLQRLDGPVRGNGKIIQELEAVFRGSGWKVIKVIWGREWDDLLAKDNDGVLVEKMNTTVDGEFQKFSVAGGTYIREHFFGPDPRLKALVSDLSDDDLARLRRGGHDYRKVYAAYQAATEFKGAPTVILAKTVKGWTLGPGVEARNMTHQAKKLSEAELKVFRDRLELPIPDDKLHDAPYYHPGADSEEVQYLIERRRALGGPLPKRFVSQGVSLPAPKPTFDGEFAAGSQTAVSTTMAFTRMLRNLMRDPDLGPRIVPIIPDEARTFGMDPLFNEVGIYSSTGQRYEPVDSELVLKYREATNGQVIEEGISEAGSAASFQAAATSYATHGLPTIPFYIFYSMFGFQRTGDMFWAAGDARSRGFLMGATAGRTTLTGEGLQHDDGHTHVLASTNPAVRPYDPTFAYELAAIIRDGIDRMHVKGEDLIYYITLYNENYPQAAKPEANGKSPDAITDGILRGIYKFAAAPAGVPKSAPRVRLVGSGSILLQVLVAQQLLAEKCAVGAEVYSAPSFASLRRDALEADRWNRLHPASKARVPYVSTVLGAKGGPIIAASDWMKIVPQGVAPWIGADFTALGTDGFGRSDTREALRSYFEIDGPSIAAAAMSALARAGDVTPAAAEKAIADLGVDPEKVDPLSA